MKDYNDAMDLLLEAEAYMPDVFKSMRGIASDANVYDETYRFVYQTFLKENTPVPEHRIIHFIGQRSPSYAVSKILEQMVSSNMLTVANISGPGGRQTYKPTPKGEIG